MASYPRMDLPRPSQFLCLLHNRPWLETQPNETQKSKRWNGSGARFQKTKFNQQAVKNKHNDLRMKENGTSCSLDVVYLIFSNTFLRILKHTRKKV